MQATPRVSVIVPVYNVEKYLRPCLDSALSQTLRDIEIICVDDGSTDHSPAILDEYAARDSRVHVIHKENGGYGKAVNTGMDAATGEYFAILESDDIIASDMYRQLYDTACQHSADVVKADFLRFATNPDGTIRTAYVPICSGPTLYNHIIEGEPARVLRYAHLYTWCGIYRLSFLRAHGIRHNETPGASYQDNGFWFQTMSLAQRVFFLPEAFYQLRRDNPDSSINSTAKVYCIRDEYAFIRDFLARNPQLGKPVQDVYHWALLRNYAATYRRVALQYKEEFARHFADTLQAAEAAHAIDWALFSPAEAADMRLMQKGWAAYHRRNRGKATRDPMQQSRLVLLLWHIQDDGLLPTLQNITRKLAERLIRRRH